MPILVHEEPDPLDWVNYWVRIAKVEPYYDQAEVCAICTQYLKKGEDVGTLLCNHQFHPECVKKWFIKKAICPVCRATARR
ncbi:hypothetical protein FGO68_gene7425 [Halteria grandinella]|uniref:RING-type E3 ubiquitin transferase n=1 Tax=Halteria grandinella TaxID=5974 RepID=A0A8J8NL91_HALGN|nr:hypothetical protein FGO68_gene7425 [Halteria grandinella]